jgi:ribosomal protein S19E (S16A)
MRLEHADAMAASLRQIKSDNTTLAIDRINKYYDEQAKESDRAMKAREASFAVASEEIESLRKIELARLKLAEAEELSRLQEARAKANPTY